jgi:hypothetical protein
LQVRGLEADKHGQETPDGVLIGNDSNGTATTAGLNIHLVAVCENAADGFGFEDAPAQVVVDLPFHGAGTATITMHVQGVITGPADTTFNGVILGLRPTKVDEDA